MKAWRIGALLAGVAVALGIVGCGGGGSGDTASSEPASTSAPPEASKKVTQEKSGENGEKPVAGGLTAPGTELKVGETASLEWVPPSEYGVKGAAIDLKVTVDAIEKGSIDEFGEVELEPDEEKDTPFYVKITVEALDEIPDSLEDEPDLTVTAIDDRGQEQGSVTFFGEFDRCNDAERPKPFAAGDSYESCMTYLMPGGGSIVAAQWNNGEGGADGAVSPYFEQPVVWKAG